MKNSEFCHLHVHTDFSTLDGFGSPEKYAKRASEMGFKYLAITDHGNIDGAIRFQKACLKEGINPILGCEIYVDNDIKKRGREAKRFHMNCFVKNETGWSNLMRMLTIAHLEGVAIRPRVDPETILKHCEGLVITSACCGGVLNADWGMKLFKDLRKKIGNDLYCEIMPHNIKEQHAYNNICLDLYEELGVKTIATNDCHYVYKEDDFIQEQLLCMQRKDLMSNPKRWKFTVNGLYLCSANTLKNSLLDNCSYMSEEEIEDSLFNTIEVAEKCCNFKLQQKEIHLPMLPELKATNQNEEEFFIKIIEDNFDKKIESGEIPKDKEQEYWDRIEEELDLIIGKGFVGYFLIVWELLNWCKENNIPVGPGRGSVGGSLTAWVINITGVDSIKYGLIFSRFINPSRADLPDIDIDFDADKRELVKDHLRALYGKNNVASVTSFSTLKAAATLQNLSRIWEVDRNEINSVTKALQLEEDEKLSADFFKSHINDPVEDFWNDEKDICLDAIDLQGTICGYGKHAAGICVSRDDLSFTDNCYLVNRGEIMCNWDKHDIEFMGLLKLDILGLSCLSRIDLCLKMIKENRGKEIILKNIPLDDEEVLGMLSLGHTSGVFQLGSYGLGKLCKELKIDSFKDIYNATALFRPGPLRTGMADAFVQRKRSGKWDKVHPLYDKITEETNGVILYQEQVMFMAHDIAGFDWGLCDKMRKIIAKSMGSEALEEFRSKFVEGCLKQKTVDKQTAEKIFNDIVSFGGYGFNKCLSGDTVVYRSNSGGAGTRSSYTIKELYDFKNSEDRTPMGKKIKRCGYGNILAYDNDGRIRPKKIKNIAYEGKKEVFEIVLKNGAKIKATHNHRFLTDKGWFEVNQLIEGVSKLATNQGYEQKIKKRYKHNNKPTGKPIPGLGGFQKGERNVAYIDGNSLRWNKRKEELKNQKSCAYCGKYFYENEKPEHHHVDGDCTNNSKENVVKLCNSCHKKADYQTGLRKVRYTKGLKVGYSTIKSIAKVGIEDVYDIEMEETPNAFIANGIVSHNSHAVQYSILSYWDAYLKFHYSAEFIASCLSRTKDIKKQQELLQRAKELNLEVMLPKVGISKANNWSAYEDKLIMPFVIIEGIGVTASENIVTETSKKRQGFFSTSEQYNLPIKVKTILHEIKAFDKKATFEYNDIKKIKKYFKINLYKLFD